MKEYQYFKQSSDPDIYAALPGISKRDWIEAKPGEPIESAANVMKKFQFDVLPLANKKGQYKGYFHTVEWGKYNEGNIRSDRIKAEDKLYYLAHIKDVIRSFFIEKRNFYFLSNRSEIIGLITIGNLNCKHVSLYYYNLISTLERNLAKFILDSDGIGKDVILNCLETVADNNNIEATKNSIKRYKDDNRKGVDGNIIEYLYLTDLFLLIEHLELYKRMGFNKKEEFNKNLGRLKKLRNVVSHSNRSLITGPNSIHDLWQATQKISDLEEHLEVIY